MAKKAKSSSNTPDVSAIEDELNKNADAQAAFLKNPSSYLAGKGLKLNAKQNSDLKGMVADMQPKNLAALAARPKIGIGISIRVRF
ncbi:MAG TPA: hypothetical protein VG387_16645 [Rhizomicrobium sp.]|nr:hypothetical protein [Rhizomicrobium sp.]